MSAKICPICETPNEPGAKACEVCGERLAIPQAAAPTEDNAVTPAEPVAAIEDAAVATMDAAINAAAAPIDLPGDLRLEAPTVDDIAEVTPHSFKDQDDKPTGQQLRELEEFDALLELDAPSLGSSRSVNTGFERERAIVDKAPPVHLPDPEPAVSTTPAKLLVYQNKQPVHAHPIVQDETLVGRYDPTSDAYPDLDLTPFDEGRDISRKHVYLYREGGRYFIYPISNSGTQVGSTIVQLGDKHELHDGDVIILAGALAMKFQR